MTERKKNILFIACILIVLILSYSRIIFTDKIIRAPDIINEFFWGVKNYSEMSFSSLFTPDLKPNWVREINSGFTDGGGSTTTQFLYIKNLILKIFNSPSSIAWLIVTHLFISATGVYAFCRLIGVSRFASLFAGIVFALAPENASLINAGHVMKIATISFAPWAFYFLEKGYQTRRIVWFLSASVVLAYQFFNTHWQIAFYTCLCIGAYGVFRSVGILKSSEERDQFPFPHLLGMNLVVMFFFLSSVAISLAPLADWSKDTNRGVQSGANQGKGGIDREEAMMWSLPPEELAAFIIPGAFGLSRQEAGENPDNIKSYYWGRMVFTQTVSYMGLLPWLLAALPLLLKRDKYTWLAVVGIVGGILFSMGKYTPFYNLLYDYFPGINRFRVPKMMMFIPVMGLGVLAARGFDLLRDETVRSTRAFRGYLAATDALSITLFILLAVEWLGRNYLTTAFFEILSQPTRYEQGLYLVSQRWNNLMVETAIAAFLSAACAVTFWISRLKRSFSRFIPFVLIILFLVDVWRINDKFMFLVKAPEAARTVTTPVTAFLKEKGGEHYRLLPLNGADPMIYASNKIPVVFTSNAVQQRRWQEYLDNLVLPSGMSDILNLKYVVTAASELKSQQSMLGEKFVPVFRSPDGADVILENRNVMPKAWLVPSVLKVSKPAQALAVMQNPQFDPRRFAVVEEDSSLQLLPPNAAPQSAGDVQIKKYEGEKIELTTSSSINSLLVLGEKYYRGWKGTVDGKSAEIRQVNYILRGVYLPPGNHEVKFEFDPLPFKIGKYLTLLSFLFFAVMLAREWMMNKRA